MQDVHFGEQMCEHIETTGKGRGLPVCVSVCVPSMFGKGSSAVMQMGLAGHLVNLAFQLN